MISDQASIHQLSNCYGCTIGAGTMIAAFVEVQSGAQIGENCKISSHSFICDGVVIEDDVFIGHGVMFTNDRHPHVAGEWKLERTVVRKGASIGTGAVILPGIEIGAGAMIGAGAIVLNDVPANSRVVSEIRMRFL